MAMDRPELDWENGTPYSNLFGDIYYSKANGLLESEYVFINQNHLEERWRAQDLSDFVIAETGFGTGLNFLAACKLWSSVDTSNKHLHFISFEKYPLTKDQLLKAHQNFPEVSELSNTLIANYPKRIKGLHRIEFSKNISLTLYFGDAIDGLNSLDENFIKVDAWFFDGFSPSSNEALWSEELFQLTRKFNKQGTSFATFTSAGHVRRKLESSGFTCEKVKGFGDKREMLTGFVGQEEKDKKTLHTIKEKPWFIRKIEEDKESKEKKIKKVAVIGAGLAGSWTAFKLQQKGISVDVFESESQIANGASGNSRGATYFKLDKPKTESLNDTQRFYLHAYLYSINEFNKLFPNHKNIWDQSGLLQLIDGTTTISKDEKINESDYDGLAYWISNEDVFKKTRIINKNSALYFPEAGSISPNKMCSFLLDKENIQLFTDHQVKQLNNTNNHWEIKTNTSTFYEYDVVVIANSYEANQLEICQHLPLNKVRGQSTQIAASNRSEELSAVICSKGYLTPAFNGSHTIGSTFDPRSQDTAILASDNDTNIEYLKQYTPEFYNALDTVKVTSAKAALRCQSPDSLPMLGQLCYYESFIENYSGISKGQLKKLYPTTPYIPGLFVNLAHASRGLISTPYCAEILCNMIFEQPLACEKSIKEALSPIRFYLRELKKSTAANH